MADKENPELPSNSFLSVLQRKELQEGLLTQGSEELAKLALAVKQTKKKGSLSLTLLIEPQKGGAISVSAAFVNKAPSTAPQQTTIFFVAKNGALVRDNPDQHELELTAHDGGARTEAEEQIEMAANSKA